jgi:hypothetical protein
MLRFFAACCRRYRPNPELAVLYTKGRRHVAVIVLTNRACGALAVAEGDVS